MYFFKPQEEQKQQQEKKQRQNKLHQQTPTHISLSLFLVLSSNHFHGLLVIHRNNAH